MEQPIRNFGFVVKDVSRLWVKHFEQRAAQLGMTLTQCKVLVFLSRNEGSTQTQLAELSDTDPMTLVRVLDRMGHDGWIERRPDPNDRRAHRLYLKPASDAVLDEIARIADKVRGEALAGLSATEREQLLTLLERVRVNLVALVPATSAGASHSASPSNSPEPARRSRRPARTDGRAKQNRRRKAPQ